VTRREFVAGIGSAAGLVLLGGCGAGSVGQSSVEKGQKKGPYRIAMVPKYTSDPYWTAVRNGGKKAAKELKVEMTFNGPVDTDVSKQSDIIDQFIQQKYDAICLSAVDPDALVPVLKRAQQQGIKVATFDADTRPEAREFFLNQCTFEAMGTTMVDMMVDEAGSEGLFFIVTETLTSPNQNEWIKIIKREVADKYPKMKIGPTFAGSGDIGKSRQVALDYMQSHPETKGVFCVTGIATPGVAEAVKQLNRVGEVAVTGLGVPSLVRPYIKSGVIKQVALWDPVKLGYGVIYISNAQLNGTIKPGQKTFEAGSLGKLKFISKDVLLLGPPLVFDKENIDDYKF
jgi:ABC-type sugar transport system substrate-binding protein